MVFDDPSDPTHRDPFDQDAHARPLGGDEEVAVRRAMGQLYGAVAALVRGDRIGAQLLLEDLSDAFDSLTELLVTISFATLERLEFAFGDQSLRPPDRDRPFAREMLTTAVGFRVAPARSVSAAAWRLEAVRCNDRSRAAVDVAGSRRAGGELQLIGGAVALLAAALTTGATMANEDPSETARRLCLAASIAPTS